MKKSKLLLLIFIFCIIIFPNNVLARNDIKIWINGDYVKTDTAPVIENNRALVPVRVISENLGYNVDWNNETREISISNNENDNIKITLKSDNNIISISNNKNNFTKNISLDTPPRIINNRTMIPVRTVSELFNHKINWDSANRTIIIGSGYIPMVPENSSGN